eukprot:5383610-Pyramimonas_sp.AAC.1
MGLVIFSRRTSTPRPSKHLPEIARKGREPGALGILLRSMCVSPRCCQQSGGLLRRFRTWHRS